MRNSRRSLERVALRTAVTLLLVAAAPLAAAPLFDADFYAFPAGPRPVAVRAVDLDGDGNLDLLAADEGASMEGSTTLTFLRGHGDGTFDPRQAIPTGNKPISVDAIDLDGDGYRDLVVSVWADKQMWMYPGATPLTFGTPAKYNLGFNPGPITLADLDGDGFVDALITHPIGSVGITVKFGAADLKFPTTLGFTTDSPTNAASAADLDADGLQDLVAANTGTDNYPDSTLALFRNLGSRTFAAPVNVVAGLIPVAIARGRFNADTLADFAVACRGDSTLRILIGDGIGGLTRTATFHYPRAAVGVAAGDFDGDGDVDLATALATNGIVIHYGNGDGTFSEGTLVQAVIEPTSIAFGDFDKDGRVDLAVGSQWNLPGRGAIAIVPGTPSGFGGAIHRSTGARGPIPIVVGDLDGDGNLDVVGGIQAATWIGTLMGDGTGHFSAPSFDTLLGAPQGLALAHLNGDDHLDLAVATSRSGGGYLILKPGNGDGTFGTGTTTTLTRNVIAPLMGDVNMDGIPDFVVPVRNRDSVFVALLDAAGAISSLEVRRLTLMPTTDNILIGVAALAKMDADPYPDLAVTTPDGVYVYWGSAGGQYTTRSLAGPTYPLPWTSIAAADVDGDGHGDLVLTKDWDEVVYIRSAGGRSFRAPQIWKAGGGEPRSVTVADVTMDGRADLILADGNAASVFAQRPDSTFWPRAEYGVGTSVQTVVVADANGDLRPDIFASTVIPSSDLTVLLSTGDTYTATTWSLIASWATTDVVQVRWQAPPGTRATVEVERNVAGQGWSRYAQLAPDGTGALTFEDRQVDSGRRYGYRLAGIAGTETWVDVPAALALDRFTIEPSPVNGRAWISFALARPGPVTVEIHDLQGRKVANRDLGSLPAGNHRLAAFDADALRPGVYLVRLRRGTEVTRAARMVVFR